jgi:hypothetical protein
MTFKKKINFRQKQVTKVFKMSISQLFVLSNYCFKSKSLQNFKTYYFPSQFQITSFKSASFSIHFFLDPAAVFVWQARPACRLRDSGAKKADHHQYYCFVDQGEKCPRLMCRSLRGHQAVLRPVVRHLFQMVHHQVVPHQVRVDRRQDREVHLLRGRLQMVTDNGGRRPRVHPHLLEDHRHLVLNQMRIPFKE